MPTTPRAAASAAACATQRSSFFVRGGVDHRRDRESLLLAEDAIGRVEAVALERESVEPRAVHVTADENDGPVGHDSVEQLRRRLVRPQAVAEAAADDDRLVLELAVHDRRAHDRDRLGGRLGTGEVETGEVLRPLREVHVLVPQAGQQPAPLDVDRLALGEVACSDRARGCDARNDAVDDRDVDRVVTAQRSRVKNRADHALSSLAGLGRSSRGVPRRHYPHAWGRPRHR